MGAVLDLCRSKGSTVEPDEKEVTMEDLDPPQEEETVEEEVKAPITQLGPVKTYSDDPKKMMFFVISDTLNDKYRTVHDKRAMYSANTILGFFTNPLNIKHFDFKAEIVPVTNFLLECFNKFEGKHLWMEGKPPVFVYVVTSDDLNRILNLVSKNIKEIVPEEFRTTDPARKKAMFVVFWVHRVVGPNEPQRLAQLQYAMSNPLHAVGVDFIFPMVQDFQTENFSFQFHDRWVAFNKNFNEGKPPARQASMAQLLQSSRVLTSNKS